MHLDLSSPDNVPPVSDVAAELLRELDDPPTLGRGRREKRPTWKIIEQRTLPLLKDNTSDMLPRPTDSPPLCPLPEFSSHTTHVDRYGMYCQYLSSVSTTSRTQFVPTPINFIIPALRVPTSLQQRASRSTSDLIHAGTASTVSVDPLNIPLEGCSTVSSRLIMGYHWSKSSKSLDDINYLVHQVIRHSLMNPNELANFDAYRETRRIDAAIAQRSDGWRESSVKIEVPDGREHPPGSENPIPIFSVPGLVHRSLTEIIKAVWSSPESRDFQFIPYRQFWTRSPSGNEERVLGELYTSEAFNEEYEKLQALPPETGCTLERIICALMLYSDSTHLANFGDAALWPLYLFFGNQSKYVRACPSSGSCHHVAYIPKVHNTSSLYLRCG